MDELRPWGSIPRFADAGAIDGVVVKPLAKNEDGRGWLAEFFREDELDASIAPAMGYVSVTNPGLARGPHEHVHQTDTFAFVGPGAFRLVLWDCRERSPTRWSRMVVEAGDDRPIAVVVPPGVVHAYACISKEAGMVINIPNRLYRGRGKGEPVDEIRHEEDPDSPCWRDFERLMRERR